MQFMCFLSIAYVYKKCVQIMDLFNSIIYLFYHCMGYYFLVALFSSISSTFCTYWGTYCHIACIVCYVCFAIFVLFVQMAMILRCIRMQSITDNAYNCKIILCLLNIMNMLEIYFPCYVCFLKLLASRQVLYVYSNNGNYA
jgi:hypothetical protein